MIFKRERGSRTNRLKPLEHFQLPKTRLQKAVAAAKRDQWEEMFVIQLRGVGIKGWWREHQFHHSRKWRFDFAWLGPKVAVEIEGLTAPWIKSRHTTNAGYSADCEKYNEAVILGWKVIRVTAPMVKNGTALELVKKLLSPYPFLSPETDQ